MEIDIFENLTKELKEIVDKKTTPLDKIRRELSEKKQVRMAFISVILNNPVRIGEVMPSLFVTRRTAYKYMWELVRLGLIRRISIMDIWNKVELNIEEKKVINKFKEWSSKMTSGQVQMYAGKTHYWALTDLAKEEGLMKWVIRLEEEDAKQPKIEGAEIITN